MALNLKSLGTRALSAVFFVIMLVFAIWYSYLSFLLLFFAVSMLALYEYYRLSKKLNASPYQVTGFLFGILLFIYFSAENLQIYVPLDANQIRSIAGSLIILCPSFILVKALFSTSPTNLLNAQYTLLGIVYAAFPLALLVSLPVSIKDGAFDYDYFKVLGIVFLIWSNDTLAYLGGSIFGKNKMYERVSPGKTWEGTIIGTLGTIGVGFLLNFNNTYDEELVWPSIALLVAVFGTIGDLVESMLKRNAGVKDSGQIMPGHGGALDRFDSLIFVTPFVYAFLKIVVF
jgi:phosphatidate cytidylyltransferase